MANICSTVYVVSAPEKTMKEIEDIFFPMEGKRISALADTGFSIKGYDMRTSVHDVEKEGENLRFMTDSAWIRNDIVMDFFAKRFSDAKVLFESEEMDWGSLESNDRNFEYFKTEFVIRGENGEHWADHGEDIARYLKDEYGIENEKGGIALSVKDYNKRTEGEPIVIITKAMF